MIKVIPTRTHVIVALEAILEKQQSFPFSIRRSLQFLAKSNMCMLHRNKRIKKTIKKDITLD